MLNISINLETGLAKPSQASVIKAGGNVPVRVIFSANPGTSPVIELACSPQSSTPEVKAYLDVFETQSETEYTGTLDANDTRLIALMSGKQTTTLDCEMVVTTDDGGRRPFPNFPVTVQPPILTGPEATEGGPVYLTEALGDARYLQPAAIATSLCRESVALPAGLDADAPADFALAGAVGQYAFDTSRSRLWFYIGAQWHFQTLISG